MNRDSSCSISLCSESGFTLVELLVACAIIAILAGLTVQSYVIYRADSYHAVAKQMFGHTRTALEAGKVDSETFNGNLTFESTTAGPAEAGDGEVLVPGLTLPEDFYVYAFHNPACVAVGCLEDYVITRHCKSDQRVVYFRSHLLGESTLLSAAAVGAC
jgi:prepilin-type N-terminal cleavage/methylation domain-containing protein